MTGLDPMMILIKAITAVLTTLALAGVGMVMTLIGVIDPAARKVLATIAMNITIPSLLWSSVLACQKGASKTDVCPELLTEIASVWQFLFLPPLWVGIGISLGVLATWVGAAPQNLRSVLVAACGFSNSTGLPLTLLTALSSVPLGEPGDSQQVQLRRFLLLYAVYQTLYPVFQWGLGGWLMAKKKELAQGEAEETTSQKLMELVKAAFAPPVIAVIVAVCMGLVPPVRGIFIDTWDSTGDAPLQWFYNAIHTMGGAAVPVNMLVLGSTLANIPSCGSIHWRSVLCVTFSKLVLHPAAGFAVMYLFCASGMIKSVGFSMRAEFVLAACLFTATPAANNLAVLAEQKSGPEAKRVLSTVVFIMYCFAPLTLTAWITVFMTLAQAQES